MEIYVAYKDYNWMMEFTEKMIEKICLDVNGTTQVKVGDNIIDFKAPYKRVTMLDSIKEHTGYDLTGMNEEQIREVCQKLNMEIDDTMGKGKLIDEIFGEFCEGTYIQPTFIDRLRNRSRQSPERDVSAESFSRKSLPTFYDRCRPRRLPAFESGKQRSCRQTAVGIPVGQGRHQECLYGFCHGRAAFRNRGKGGERWVSTGS